MKRYKLFFHCFNMDSTFQISSFSMPDGVSSSFIAKPFIENFILDKLRDCESSFPQLEGDLISLKINFDLTSKTYISLPDTLDDYCSKEERVLGPSAIRFMAIVYHIGDGCMMMLGIDRILVSLKNLFQAIGVNLKTLGLSTMTTQNLITRVECIQVSAVATCMKNAFSLYPGLLEEQGGHTFYERALEKSLSTPVEEGRCLLIENFIVAKLREFESSFPKLEGDLIILEINCNIVRKTTPLVTYDPISKYEEGSRGVVNFMCISYDADRVNEGMTELKDLCESFKQLFRKTGVDLNNLILRAMTRYDGFTKRNNIILTATTFCMKSRFDNPCLSALVSSLSSDGIEGRSTLIEEFVMDQIHKRDSSFPKFDGDSFPLKTRFVHYFETKDTEPFYTYAPTSKYISNFGGVVCFMVVTHRSGDVDGAIKELERASESLVLLFQKVGVDMKNLYICAMVIKDKYDEKMYYTDINIITHCIKDRFEAFLLLDDQNVDINIVSD